VVQARSPEKVWVGPGTLLHAAPSRRAAVVATADRYTEVPVLRRRPAEPEQGEERPAEWLWVRLDNREGWVRRVEPPPGEPPLGRDPAPVLPVPALPPDPERLALARQLLGPGHTTGSLGPYLLVTDVADPELLARLAAVAEAVEPVYRQRYGLGLVGQPAEAVLLFDREVGYRTFQHAERALEGLPSAGHAGHGLVALFRQDRSWEELAATLVHELTHLLNRRALGPVLPPWLDEGLAEDLAWSRLGDDGRPRPGTFGGLYEVGERTVRTTGGLAVLSALGRLVESTDLGLAPTLEELVRLDWDAFVHTDRQLHYRQSGLLIRFLLDGAGGELAPGFRGFLAETAAGEPLGAERLAAALGLPWPAIEARYRQWLEELGVAPSGSSSLHTASPPA
jgi:hypothetical protein